MDPRKAAFQSLIQDFNPGALTPIVKGRGILIDWRPEWDDAFLGFRMDPDELP
jgi:hypothetical protein